MKDKRMISAIAITGPWNLISKIKLPMFDVVHKFGFDGEKGDFPDTTGYTDENWEKMAPQLKEDPDLWPWMSKCMDAILEFTLKYDKEFDEKGMINIHKIIQFPKFGGAVFAVVGFVQGEKSSQKMGNRILVVSH